jgi:DNA-directed RNA polymerase specialized sigma24 family protein
MNSLDSLVLMLNVGWSLQDIAAQAGMPVKTVERIIVAEVRRERLAAKISPWA